MILDPFGDVIAECRALGDEAVIGLCVREKLEAAGGFRYRKARRPDLYRDIIGAPHAPEQRVAWMEEERRRGSSAL